MQSPTSTWRTYTQEEVLKPNTAKRNNLFKAKAHVMHHHVRYSSHASIKRFHDSSRGVVFTSDMELLTTTLLAFCALRYAGCGVSRSSGTVSLSFATRLCCVAAALAVFCRQDWLNYCAPSSSPRTMRLSWAAMVFPPASCQAPSHRPKGIASNPGDVSAVSFSPTGSSPNIARYCSFLGSIGATKSAKRILRFLTFGSLGLRSV